MSELLQPMTQQRPAAVEAPAAGRMPTLVAMQVFLLGEAMFFIVFILVFVYGRATAPARDLAGQELLDPVRAGLFTLLLVASSGTILLAERAHAREQRRGVRNWLFATAALGAIFLLGQATEYLQLYGDGLTVASNLFGTGFFTLTGLHFLHVAAGVVLLLVLAVLAAWGRADEPPASALQPIALYWHFVDVVWVVLYAVIYLLGVR